MYKSTQNVSHITDTWADKTLVYYGKHHSFAMHLAKYIDWTSWIWTSDYTSEMHVVAKYLIYKIYFLIGIYNVWHDNITGSLLNLIMYGFMVCNYDG